MIEKAIRCPQCGHVVQDLFDHVDINCEHDMTEEEIAALRQKVQENNGDA